jgi:Tol biopolymer transport system component
MRRTLTIIGLMITLTGGAIAQRNQAEIDLQAAIRTETVDGDLQKAIGQYREVVSKHKADRATAATALMRIAECYQKLGDTEANKIYEQIVREYSDQKDAVSVARARLANGTTRMKSDAMVNRRSWTLPSAGDALGAAISPDGSIMSFVDWNTGDLAVHNFSTHRDRLLTNKGTWTQSLEFAEFSTISADGKQVAYSWYNGKDYDLRVIPIDGSRPSQAKVLFANDDVEWLAPMDWSPDGRWIAVQLARADHTGQLALVSTEDSSLRVLKSSEWRGAAEVFFSADGRYVGFDLPADDANSQRDVFVLAIDGSSQAAVAAGRSHDTMVGWSPDGSHLLFASDRAGSVGLWSQSITDGKPQGSPQLLKPDISRESLGLTQGGQLFVGVRLGGRDIHVAAVDFATGKVLTTPVRPIQTYVGSNHSPNWSPDGKSMAFLSTRDRAGVTRVLGIYSAETAGVRELRPQLAYFDGPRWAPDGQSIIVRGRDLKGRPGGYQVNVQTGDAKLVVPAAEGTFLVAPEWSLDGTKIYYRRVFAGKGAESALVEHDIATGTERVLETRKELLGNPNLSPDGRWIATTSGDQAIWLFPVFEGEARELFRAKRYTSLGIARDVEWMPDGRGLLFSMVSDLDSPSASSADAKRDLLFLPIEGGAPRKINLEDHHCCNGVVKIHPDGRQIAFIAGESKSEVWVLENFLPNPRRTK